jgi:hypothetical protein
VALRHLAAAARRSTPWKNGGGVTQEIAAYPPGAGLDEFDWRISTARVESDGPFSRFEGVDRVLTILEGALELRLGDGAPVVLTDASDPFAFPGDAPCSGAPRDGAVVDLNVMVRRGRVQARVFRLIAPALIIAGSDILIVLTLAPTTLNGLSLQSRDAVQAGRGETIRVDGSWPGLIAIELKGIVSAGKRAKTA